jgi:hypothetical protein
MRRVGRFVLRFLVAGVVLVLVFKPFEAGLATWDPDR